MNKVNNNTIVNGPIVINAKLNRIVYTITYDLNGGKANNPTTYTIEDNDKLLEDFEINGPTVTLTANEDNNVGSIKIIAEFEDNRLEKEVKITSLWV